MSSCVDNFKFKLILAWIFAWIFTINEVTGLCPARFTGYGSFCYGIDPNSIKNWTESEKNCLNFGGHLTSITDDTELSFLQYFISGQRKASPVLLSDALWIGLHHHQPFSQPGQARFAYRQGWTWTDNTVYNYLNPWDDNLWAFNAPVNGQDCAVIGLSGNKIVGKFQGQENNHGICKLPATCPTAFYQLGKYCYMIDPEKEATRRMYQQFCSSLGGYLTSISSGEELTFLDRKLKQTFPSSYTDETFWIGLQNPSPMTYDGPTVLLRSGWQWSDGLRYNVSLDVVWDWIEPHPGERYTYMKNFIWYGTTWVEERRKGICKIDVSQVKTPVTTSTTTSTTQVKTTPTPTTKMTTTAKVTKMATQRPAPTSTMSATLKATTKMSTPSTLKTTTIAKSRLKSTIMSTIKTTIKTTPKVTSPTSAKILTTPTTASSTQRTTSKTTTSTQHVPKITKPVVLLSSYFKAIATTFKPVTTSTITYPRVKQTSTVVYPPLKNTPNINNVNRISDNFINNNINTAIAGSATENKGISKYAPAFVAAPVLVLFIVIIIILVRKGFICSGGSGTSPGRKQRINSTPARDTQIPVDNIGYYLSYPGISVVEKEYKSIPGNYGYPNHIGRWQPEKNTFRNYIPYDDNRVTLEQKDGKPNSDYINASFIKGYCSSHKTYIAAQGPRENTLIDFWRMVWEHGVTVMIMLTSPAESGKGKCLVYWPLQEGESVKYGEVKVMLDRQRANADDTVRTFFVKKGGQSRRVMHFYFHTWPDSGAPTYPVTLINFRRKVKKQMSSSNPVLIHCSSGVGRSGTFIAIDYLLEQAALERVVDVYSCVTKLRKQRPWMVSNLREYKSIYHCVNEGVMIGSTTISRNQFYNIFRLLTTTQHQESGGTSSLQQQFKLIKSIEAEQKLLGKIDTIRALMRGIVKSSKKAEKQVETFLRLDGFNKPNAFILTSAPLVTKIGDFWNTVHERKCKAVVMLCPRENISFIQTYFPDEEEATFPAAPFTVECLSVREDGSQFPVIAKEMKIEGKGKPRHNFCHISVKSDLARLPVPSQAAVLVYLRNLSRKRCHDTKTNTRFPMLVHCLTGRDWTGVFYVLCNVLEQLDADNEVDIFQAVRQARHLHPHLIQTEEQYTLLYEAVACYIQKNDHNC